MAGVNAPTKKSKSLLGFIAGVLCTQFVNSALHLAQPLLMADLTGSIGYAAFFSSFDTAIHMCGTMLGGWPTDWFGARRVLIVSTLMRGISLAAIPLGMIYGSDSTLWIMFFYTVDALVRGFVDSSVYTLPLELAEHDAAQLDRLNSRYEICIDIGGIAGPLTLGGLLYWFHQPIIPHIMISGGFILAAILFTLIPQAAHREKSNPKIILAKNGGSWLGLKAILADKKLLIVCLGYMSFNIYPLRKLMSAFFAKAILFAPGAAGTLGASYGAGGLVGTIIYSRFKNFGNRAVWIFAGAAGILLLAVGWIPHLLIVMCLAAFFFSMTNAGARLSLMRFRQELTPLELAGGVTSVSRFGANLVSVITKALVGLAFTLGGGAQMAFAIIGAILGVISLGQFFLAGTFQWRQSSVLFSPKPQCQHKHYPLDHDQPLEMNKVYLK